MRKRSEDNAARFAAEKKQDTHLNNRYPAEAPGQDDGALVQNLIGLGAFSARKSYYPELLQKIDEIENEKERYQWLFENALHGIFQAKADGGIQAANPAISRICGYNSPEEFCQSITSVRNDLFEQPEDFDFLLERLTADGPQRAYETLFRRKRYGQTVPVAITPLMKDQDKGIIEVFVHDITDRKRAQLAMARLNSELEQRVVQRTKELQQAKLEAEEANISKDKYLAAASHDLLQPLNAARLLVATLQEKSLNPDAEILVERIHTALSGAEELLGDLLDISRLDANAVTPDVEEFDLDEIFCALYSEFQPVAEEAGLELRMVPSHHRVRSDARLLMRILRNFLSNAIRYTATGRVLIGCRLRGDALDLMIADSGPGIPTNERQAIFREFRQLDNAQAGRSKGVGLGLAIVERISRMLGHQIQVESRVGIGSRFSVRVPRAARPATLEESGSASNSAYSLPTDTPPPRFTETKVLVIDNEESIRHSMAELLATWGCEVATAGSTAEAFMVWTGFKPHLVLADYHLDNEETGTELIAEFWNTHPDSHRIPVVVITADRSDQVRQKVITIGATRLNKPVKPAKLRALMAHLLDHN